MHVTREHPLQNLYTDKICLNYEILWTEFEIQTLKYFWKIKMGLYLSTFTIL